MLTTFVLEAQENLLTWFRIFISWLFCNQEEIGCGRKGYGYGTSSCVFTIITSYTNRCTRLRHVCWCKFGWNPTRSFCVICNLVSLSLIQRQALSLDFACLFIHCLAMGPELFACLSMYENAETCPLVHQFGLVFSTTHLIYSTLQSPSLTVDNGVTVFIHSTIKNTMTTET